MTGKCECYIHLHLLQVLRTMIEAVFFEVVCGCVGNVRVL